MAYTFIEKIGSGGMGCVYKAQDDHGHIVAVKMMSNKVACLPDYREMFQAEVETLSRMDHPSVVHIVGAPYSDASGNLYLPMEFVEGLTLDRYIGNHGGMLSAQETIHIMGMVLDAMQYVHQRGRIHRDIKPSNIMLRPNGSVCLIDFGIAKDSRVGSGGRTVGRIMGTDGYMSPEQANGLNIDSRTDIYSLGCVMFYMLTGQHAVAKGKNEYETVCNILRGKMTPPSQARPGVSPLLDNVFLRAVDANMTVRYQTAAQFKDAILDVTGQRLPRVTVGSQPDNDIVVKSDIVSRHHLTINGHTHPITGGGNTWSIEVVDHSTNGTGVNGMLLRHNTTSIPFSGTAFLPMVQLAGLPQFTLNWQLIVALLKQRGWQPVDYGAMMPPPIPQIY